MLHKDENGYIVVETVGGFVLFIFFVISILSLVNVVSVQNRVHYALSQTAQELSMYSYILEVTGAADIIKDTGVRADKAKTGINELRTSLNGVLNGIQGVAQSGQSGNIGGVIENGQSVGNNAQNAGNQIGGMLEDPMETLGNFFAMATINAKDALAQQLVEPVFEKYMVSGDASPDEYLKSWNVVDGMAGMDFSETTFIDSEGNIELVVRYRIKYSFGALPLPFDELHVTQKAKIRAWLDGNGKGYS